MFSALKERARFFSSRAEAAVVTVPGTSPVFRLHAGNTRTAGRAVWAYHKPFVICRDAAAGAAPRPTRMQERPPPRAPRPLRWRHRCAPEEAPPPRRSPPPPPPHARRVGPGRPPGGKSGSSRLSLALARRAGLHRRCAPPRGGPARFPPPFPRRGVVRLAVWRSRRSGAVAGLGQGNGGLSLG